MSRVCALRLLLIAIVLTAILAATASANTVAVRFFSNGELILAQRSVADGVPIPQAAVQALVAGPTQLERTSGITSRIPSGVSVTGMTVAGGVAEIDLSEDILIGLDESTLQDIFDQFRTTLGDYSCVSSIKLTCKGNLLSSYLQQAPEVGVAAAPSMRAQAVTSGVGLSGRKICLGPSHGREWVGWWGWQRSDPCGFGEAVLEDTNSIRLVQFLKAYLTQDGATVECPRQLDESDCCNSDTGLPWWKMCAETWLHHAGAPSSVWASYSGNTGADTAVDRSSDDIRARPLWADYTGSDIYIACHTNAGGGGTANGTETYRDTAMEHSAYVTNSLNLATAVQNNVVAAIRDMYDSGWASRGVKDSAGGFGEIRIPNRPACLIELAFHDNCSRDALYLTDDFFRSVAEWGLYSGICAYFGNTPTWDKYSCEYVSDTIPATMTPGQTYNVSVTLRNRGVCWFTSNGFRLGAVGDSDPFASFTRVDISGEVKPTETYTFNYTLTAPSTTGVYTTGWRMVRDGYAWFGPTVTKQIAVGTGVVDPPEQTGSVINSYTYDWTSNPTSFTNTWATASNEWYIYDHLTDCSNRGYKAYWNPGFTWNGRGQVHYDFYVGSHGTSRVQIHSRNTSGADGGWSTWLEECPVSGMQNILDAAQTNLSNFNGCYVNADESVGKTVGSCNANCGSRITSIGSVHEYGARWQYIDDWTCLGGYGSSSVSDTANRDFAFGESGLYLYPAVDSTHGDVITSGLGFSGKTPGRVTTGDCNNANSLNFKGNASAYGGDNMDAYGFAWVYAPSGAGPKFDIGSDDGNRVWVNGNLINDSNSSRGLTRDQDVTGSISLGAGWNRVLFKVHSGTGAFEGTISLRNGSDNRWNEPSVRVFDLGGYLSYGLGYEQDAWYPHLDVSNFDGMSNPSAAAQVYTNDTTVTAGGTAAQGGPVPLWKVMHFEWGYGLSGDTNYTDVTSSGASWSHTQAGVTGHRRFHFFGVSKSGRTSFQSGSNSGKTGGWNWADGGPGNYMDVFVDNVAPLAPSLAGAVSGGPNEVSLTWALPLDQGVNVAAGATESADMTSGGTNHYRRGDVGVCVRRNGSTTAYDWGNGVAASDAGLDSNTQYTYDIAARDNTSGTRGAWHNVTDYVGATSVWTLAEAPAGGVNISLPASGTYRSNQWPGVTSTAFGFGNHKVTKFKYKWSANAADSISEGEGTDWSAGALSALPETSGTYYLYVRSYNQAGVGNGAAQFGPYEIEYDVTAPTVDSVTSPAYSNESPISVTYAATDTESGVKQVTLWTKKGESGSWAATSSVSSSATGSFSYSVSEDGTYYFGIVAEDNAGNKSADPTGAGSANTVFDTTAPTVQVSLTAESTGATGDFLQGALTTEATPDDAGGSGVAKVEMKLDDGDYSEVIPAEGKYSDEKSISSSWANGPHSITVKATDNAENSVEVEKDFTVNKNKVSGQIALGGLALAPVTREVTFILNGGVTRKVSLCFVKGVAAYAFTDVDGVNAISAKTAWHLRKKMSGFSPYDGQTTANFTGSFALPGGDLNGDNQVNTVDYSMLRNAWGTGAIGDINGDGVCDNTDYLILKANWYTKGDSQ